MPGPNHTGSDRRLPLVLGIVLLLAPLATVPPEEDLRAGVGRVLGGLDVALLPLIIHNGEPRSALVIGYGFEQRSPFRVAFGAPPA